MLGSSGVLDPSNTDLGLIPRLCHDLFTRIDSLRWEQQQLPAVGDSEASAAVEHLTDVSVTASFLEVYCETVRDLFSLERLANSGGGSAAASPASDGVRVSASRDRAMCSTVAFLYGVAVFSTLPRASHL